ncbi:phospholipase D-like domain-containing protein [Hansschlegelia sp.]|uniref:phospholipase D-like domain-containing protein n=1 Tax=Hansschlegelia sp. TaxID=2041892 RepID=UPI002C542D35|nr:phospholipase D-like domain-containing protein [Hansschlegelia sp.]HVI28789.1 phospholipase D-like domain-containing protein [Hansschlegelia sp.]
MMKARLLVALVALATVSSASAETMNGAASSALHADNARVDACFTPGDACDDMLGDAIDKAQRQILVQAMFFSNKKLMRGLANAHKRGVDVKMIMSIGSEKKRSKNLLYFMKQGIPILIDANVKTQHNKVMIIDNAEVFTGSYNFTYSAQRKNAENMVRITDSPEVVSSFVNNWKRRAAASRPVDLKARDAGKSVGDSDVDTEEDDAE